MINLTKKFDNKGENLRFFYPMAALLNPFRKLCPSN